MTAQRRERAGAIAAAIAAFGLHDENPVLRTVTTEDWRRLLPEVASERLAGMALAAADDGCLAIPEIVIGRLMDLHRDAMMWALTLEGTLGSVLSALRGEGVEPVLLKGPVLAHTRYPDPSWRPFADLDLLVRDGERARASAALIRAGFRPLRPEPRKGFDDRFGKAVVHRDDRSLEIDLHRTLAQGPFAVWIVPSLLIDRAVPVEVAGSRTSRLDDTGLFLHACVHASLGGREPSLLMLRDVAQCWNMSVDWDLVRELSRGWRLAAVVRHACLTTGSRLRVALPRPVHEATAVAPPQRDARALRAYTGPRRDRGGTELALLACLPGLRERVAYAASLLVPSRAFLRARAPQLDGRATYTHRWAIAAQTLGQKGRG